MKFGKRHLTLIAFAAISSANAATVHAQAGTTRIAMGAVTSAETCTTYELRWGKESFAAAGRTGAVAGGGMLAYGASAAMAYRREWGSELVRDCVNNFAELKQSIRDALASSGRIAIGNGGYSLDVSVSPTGSATRSIARNDMTDTLEEVTVQVSFSLRERSGRSGFGGTFTKKIPLSADLSTDYGSFASSTDSLSAYASLQRSLALAVARAVTFHFDPLRVTDVEKRRVRLNYGAPLIEQGNSLLIPTRRGMSQIKAEIVSIGTDFAIAEIDGSGTMDDVAIGTSIRLVEPDDPAANSRRYDHVELP